MGACSHGRSHRALENAETRAARYTSRMWVVFGTNTRTEPALGGARAERVCERCGVRATFREHRAIRSFSLYFMPIFDYRKERVMACGACGTLFSTNELGPPDAAVSEGWEQALSEAGTRARAALEEAAVSVGPAMESAGKLASEFFSNASAGLSPAVKKAGQTLGRLGDQVRENVERLRGETHAPSDDDDDDEVDPEKAELLRRFAELEAKMKAKDPQG